MYIYNLGLLFYKISSDRQGAPAIHHSGAGQISYNELNHLSNRIANYLQELKIGKYDVIGIFNTKEIESYALMLACLKTGVIYVNLDVSSPYERIKKIIAQCNPRYLFFDDPTFFLSADKFEVPVINIKSLEIQNHILDLNTSDLEITDHVCADNPAYIMFTSGSTGFPKGAVMTHQNLLNFINWAREEYQITSEDILTNVNPMYFDNSVFDFYSSLFNGASLAPFDSHTVKQPDLVVKRVDQVKATIWFSVPSMLVFLLTTKSLTTKEFQHIRVITFGGEGFPKPKLKQLYDLYHERVRIVNVYGPTECTCICSAYDVSEDDFLDMTKLAPLGYLAANFNYLILNKEPETGIGELALSGPQVGPGYYNDPERTNVSFIHNPDRSGIHQIIYRTGDLVREDEKGMLHIVGRTDNQIKHMGYRIELEDIESGFNSLKFVKECGVIYKKINDSLGQIIAYISVNDFADQELISREIKKILPSYMLPKQIHILNKLPKNQNGKIDRIALQNLE
jgi:D-alanine--poly(phosphoribitol) ligase subunit 1